MQQAGLHRDVEAFERVKVLIEQPSFGRFERGDEREPHRRPRAGARARTIVSCVSCTASSALQARAEAEW